MFGKFLDIVIIIIAIKSVILFGEDIYFSIFPILIMSDCVCDLIFGYDYWGVSR